MATGSMRRTDQVEGGSQEVCGLGHHPNTARKFKQAISGHWNRVIVESGHSGIGSL